MKQLREEIQDKCIEILRATRDGDDLTKEQLRLVELGVNGKLNLAGAAELQALYLVKV